MITIELTIDKLDENTMLENDKLINSKASLSREFQDKLTTHQQKIYWKIVRAIQRARISGEIE